MEFPWSTMEHRGTPWPPWLAVEYSMQHRGISAVLHARQHSMAFHGVPWKFREIDKYYIFIAELFAIPRWRREGRSGDSEALLQGWAAA